MEKYQLSTEMTVRLWSSLRNNISLSKLFISDSSLSFPPSPPELTSVIQLDAKRVTSESYEGLLSSLPGLKVINITTDDAERDISQITAGLRRSRGQQLTNIRIEAPAPIPSENMEKENVSRETMKGLGLLIKEHIKSLESLRVSGVNCTHEDCTDLIEHVKSSKILRSLYFRFLGWGSLDYNPNAYSGPTVTIGDCQLSTEMTVKLWNCLRSFPALSTLIISKSSLSFPPSPPELLSIAKLEAKRVRSQSYEGLLSSLPGLAKIDITIDDAETDLSQIMACLRRTGGVQLTNIRLHALEKKTLSRETTRGLGLLIREQTKKLQTLILVEVKCTDEEDLVYLVECCRQVKTMKYVGLLQGVTEEGGRLQSHLERLHSPGDRLEVQVWKENAKQYKTFEISHIQ